MEIISLLVVVVIAFLVVFFGRILSHGLRFIFYFLLIILVVVFVFGISLTEFIDFLKGIIYLTF